MACNTYVVAMCTLYGRYERARACEVEARPVCTRLSRPEAVLECRLRMTRGLTSSLHREGVDGRRSVERKEYTASWQRLPVASSTHFMVF